MKSIFFLSLLFLGNAFAAVEVDLIKENTPKFQTLNISKENNLYFLNFRSFGMYNSKGQQIDFSKRDNNYKMIHRNIKIPIKIEVVDKTKVGNTVQFLGFGDDDVKTGDFKNLNNLRLSDLFTSYEGTSSNIGLTFIGGGYTTMTASNGATLKEGNGSILFIGPTGTPIGVNAGIHYREFTLNISTNFKAAKVEYTSTHYVDGKKFGPTEELSRVESMDELLLLELTNS